MARAEVIDDLAPALALAPAWDRLAAAASLPLCAPGWMLSWWKHLAPAGSELRITVVRDGNEPIAVAPWFAHKGPHSRLDLRFLGAENSDRVDILCLPGREREVVRALRGALRSMRPRPDLVAFEAVPAGSRWTRLLAHGGIGGARLAPYRNSTRPAPAVTLPRDMDQWLASRSNHFRKHLRWLGRRLAAADGAVRMLREPGEVRAGLETMLALHRSRWEGRGQSGLARAGMAGMLIEAARMLGPDRLRLWCAEIGTESISVQLFLSAGREVKFWNGGWSQRHSALQPSMQTIVAALGDAIERGERRMDMGVGLQSYKLRFADTQDRLTWGGVIVRNRRWPVTRAELAPLVLRYRAKQLIRSLPDEASTRVEALLRRSSGEEAT